MEGSILVGISLSVYMWLIDLMEFELMLIAMM